MTDRTSRSLALIWQPNSAAAGFNIYRSLSSAGPFVQIASMVKGASFSDKELAQDTACHYEIRAVDASNNVTLPTSPISWKTAAIDPPAPPACDPYFSDNQTHVAQLRAVPAPIGGGTLAVGSLDAMGPLTDHDFKQLTKEDVPLLFLPRPLLSLSATIGGRGDSHGSKARNTSSRPRSTRVVAENVP